MKKRTFYATFLLFLSAIYICMLCLSVITLKGTMQQARRQCLNEQYFIASALYRDMAALENRGISYRAELDSLMSPICIWWKNAVRPLRYMKVKSFSA